MHAYEYDNLPGDPRLPHLTPKTLTSDDLAALHIETFHFPATSSGLSAVDTLALTRSYRNRDEVTISPVAMGKKVYEAKLKIFFEEHLHEDEEIRWVVGGSGFFDVRDEREDQNGGGRWVRMKVEEGDLLVLPKGVYHRFTTDEGDYIKAVRLFQDEPKWTPLNRAPEVDVNEHRKEYLERLANREL
ncbi:Acireductone dioxygenase ARD family, partial [Peziza echinospora]